MKKSVCLMAVLGAFAAAGANAATTEEIPVNFVGEVKAATCKVTVGQSGNTINLGRVDLEANSKGTLVPVTFSFYECKTTAVNSIELTSGQNGHDDNVTNGTLATKVKEVSVKLYNDRSAGQTFNKKVTLDEKNTGKVEGGKLTTTPFFARLEVGGTGPAPAGTVDSNALFTVTYK